MKILALLFLSLLLFFPSRSLSRTFTFHKTAGAGGGYSFKLLLPPPPTSQTVDISQAITAETSLLHIQLVAGLEPGTFVFREQVANVLIRIIQQYQTEKKMQFHLVSKVLLTSCVR